MASKKRTPIGEVLAANLEALMERRQINQSQLSRLAEDHGGLSQKTVSRILRRERSTFHLDQLDTLADTLGVTPAQLVTDGAFPRKGSR